MLHIWVALALASCTSAARQALPLVLPGDAAVIPTWDVQSSAKVSHDPALLSILSSVNGSSASASWHHAPVSRCTVMGCLLAAGVYNDTGIFYSDNMKSISKADFQVPWLYRSEFSVAPVLNNAISNTHYLLETHGITSRADIYLNGQKIADKSVQSGAYGGHVYDITSALRSNSSGSDAAIVVRAYPTNYLKDFGLGFVDWNPYPPDNGTGVWRDIIVRKTGSVAIESFFVTTNFTAPGVGEKSLKSGTNGIVSLKATVRNLETTTIIFHADSTIAREDGSDVQNVKSALFTLAAGETKQIILTNAIPSPSIWWPRQWGEQPLYKAKLTLLASTGFDSDQFLSDTVEKNFGFRQVTSSVSSSDDILFSVNGRPFQVLGGGYTPDVFLRWDAARFEAHALYTLDMGLNTIRLEGKMEHPDLYDICDRLGLMVLPGWECCDKWEAWSYNDNLPAPIAVWSEADYTTANVSMRHEAEIQQSHPSLLGFLVGSDFWPDDRATDIYIKGLADVGWQAPIVASAAKTGHSRALGPGGMKMAGPYDWVPPNYWYDTQPQTDDERYGAAFGFGSEQGAGVGTPTLSSLSRFLSPADLEDLWNHPKKGLYHMSTAESSFHTREIFNNGLWKRYGAPTSLDDYLMKTQMADYEATRAMFEAFEANWGTTGDLSVANTNKRPATGVIYWMLNGAWPALHWQLFDYYLHPAGAYYGVKAGTGGSQSDEHLIYNYGDSSVVYTHKSQAIASDARRSVRVELISAVDAKVLSNTTTVLAGTRVPNTSRTVDKAVPGVSGLKDVALLKLTLLDAGGAVIDRNTYWLSATLDQLDWDNSNWFYTPVTKYASLESLNKVPLANVTVTVQPGSSNTLVIENKSPVPAIFVSLNLVDASGADVNPIIWSENYVTLFPRESIETTVRELYPVLKNVSSQGVAIELVGRNVAKFTVPLG